MPQILAVGHWGNISGGLETLPKQAKSKEPKQTGPDQKETDCKSLGSCVFVRSCVASCHFVA